MSKEPYSVLSCMHTTMVLYVFVPGGRNNSCVAPAPLPLPALSSLSCAHHLPDSAKHLTFTISSSPLNSPVREGPMPEVRAVPTDASASWGL